ncbi:hypothetical protein [Janthinobacterium agaricidamnosum]|uniref:hypothetical protein n=1 Tax=Janthinobacterium agaricidamnosum TaxID=55508 RepID=UPI000773C7EC|nr:hypothetical protein [Janthinobacterium agaricidamnosum]
MWEIKRPTFLAVEFRNLRGIHQRIPLHALAFLMLVCKIIVEAACKASADRYPVSKVHISYGE